MEKKSSVKKLLRLTGTKTSSLLPEGPIRFKIVDSKEEYQSQQQLLLALQRISKILAAETDLQKILKDMATIVAKALGAKWVNFWNLTPNGKAVYIVAHYGMQPQYMHHSRRYPITLGRAWIGRAVKTGQAWGTSDILNDPILLKDLGSKWAKAIKKQNYRGLLCVPLNSGKKIVGGLCAYFVKPHEFTDFEMRLMTIAANQAATAVLNSKIFNELLTERNKSIAMVDSLSDGLILYDLEGKIIEFNPKSQEMLWVRRSEILNKNISSLSVKNVFMKNIIAISSLAIKDFETHEFSIKKPQRVFLKITQMPVRDSRDKKLGTMRILHDITAEKETEELKSRFVSVASHQLRTPLSRIKWLLDAFLKGELGELSSEQTEFLERLNGENEQMINIIRDLLDVSRMEEGRFGYDFRSADMIKIIKQIVSGFSQVIQKKSLHLNEIRASGKLPKILIDKEKLKLAIENVIDNAIKYTLPGGKISLSLYKKKTSFNIIVKDNGIGIPRDQQKFIFTKFFRARNAIRLQTEGSGLGLWIASEIIKKHNGAISFKSEEGKGATFFIQLPFNS